MSHSFHQPEQDEYPAISRYKYLVQDEDLEEFVRPKTLQRDHRANWVPARDPALGKPWPIGFMLLFATCISALLWLWIIGAFLWIRHHFS